MSDTNMPLIIALVGYWAVGFPVAWYLRHAHAVCAASASGSA